jgi:hypothetical protein
MIHFVQSINGSSPSYFQGLLISILGSRKNQEIDGMGLLLRAWESILAIVNTFDDVWTC